MLAQPIPLPSGYLLGGKTGISIAFESDGRWTEIADLKFRHEENCRLPACPDGPASPRFPYRGSGNLHGRYPLVCRADYPLETVTRAQLGRHYTILREDMDAFLDRKRAEWHE